MSKEAIQLPFTLDNSDHARQVVEDILEASKQDASLLTADGKPTTDVLSDALGVDINASDRDTLWSLYDQVGNSKVSIGTKWLVSSKYFRHIHDGETYTKEPTEVDPKALSDEQRDAMNANPLLNIRIVCDFAYEYLLSISHQHLSDELNDTRKSHEAYLTRLAKGIVTLDLPLAEGDDNTASGEVEFTASSGRIFGRTKR